MIINDSTGKVLAKESHVMSSFIKKAWGLMFRSSVKGGFVFPFGRETKWDSAVHSFFVFTPLTVVWLDKDKRVFDVRLLKPFTVAVPNGRAKWVVELPEHSFKDVNVGDIFSWILR